MNKTETTTGNSNVGTIELKGAYKTYAIPKMMRNKIGRFLHFIYANIHFDLFFYPNIPNRNAIIYTQKSTS